MKKRILLISGGIAAGVAAALIAVKKTGRHGKGAQREQLDNATGESFGSGADTSEESEDRAESVLSDSDHGKQASMKNLGDSGNVAFQEDTPLDDRGTDQETASEILTRVRDGAFDASDEKLALALGRPTEEITAWLNGSQTIDGDVLLKSRALAMERGVDIPESPHAAVS